MARKPQVNYYPTRGGYYTQINGKQHLLARGPDDAPYGETYRIALAAYGDLVCGRDAKETKDASTVRTICNLYLDHVKADKQPRTYSIRRNALTLFCNSGSPVVGEQTVRTMLPMHVTEFLRDSPAAANTVKAYIDSIKACLNWAVAEGLLTRNPLARVKRPASTSRSRHCLVSPADHASLLTVASDHFLPVLVALENTGARPSEVVAATAADWRADLGAVVYHGDATRREGEHRAKVGRDRFIIFTGTAREMVAGLVASRSTGPLFRNAKGTRWKLRSLNNLFVKLRKRLGILGISPMSYRHTYATRWLEAGRPIETLAALMGNSPAVIRHHYSHLLGGYLKTAADDFAELRRAAEG